MPRLVSIEARGNAEVAVAYIATPDHGGPLLGSGERFLNWVGYSPDAIHEPFVSATSSKISHPALVADGLFGGSISCCATLHYFIEYAGVAFTGPGEIRAAFVRDRGHRNPILVFVKAHIDD